MNKEEFLSEIGKVDEIKLEEYYPFDKAVALGKLTKRLEDDKKHQKFAMAERMLLNNPATRGGEIADIWNYVMKNLNGRPDFWSYDETTVKYFEDRLASSNIPSLASARIYYYLWTAKKEIKFATKSVELFTQSGMDHLEDPEKYWQVPEFCFEFAFTLSRVLGNKNIINTLIIPKLLEAIDSTDIESFKHRSLKKLFLQISPEIFENFGEKERHFLTSLLKDYEALEAKSCSEDNFHQANQCLDLLKTFYCRMKNLDKVDLVNRKILDNLIKMAEQNPDPMLKTTWYKSAIDHMLKYNIKDGVKQKELTELLTKYHKESLSHFKKIETSVTIDKKEFEKEALRIIGNEKDSENIIKILSRYAIPSYAKHEAETKQRKHVSIALSFPLIRESPSHISNSYSTEEERIGYEILNQIGLSLQFNSIVIKEAMNLSKIEQSSIFSLIDKSKISDSSKEIIKRGIERHFSGDFISSVHNLVFQLEQLIREVMILNGHSNFVFDQKSNSVRQRTLDSLIREYEVERILGKDFVSAMSSYISNVDHHNLRNETGHGIIDVEKINDMNSTIILFLNLFIISNFLL